jgi:serine/threonine protein kinase, bacterial
VEGLVFGRYRLVELLGRGGMGEVWRADDSLTGRVVALKLLLAQFTDDEDFQRRFRLEARAAASLNEPHVVPIHGFGEIDGRLFVDMRLIEGRDLKSMLDEGPLAPERAVSIVEQVASALKAAHQIGLVHRDVKPSNVLVTEDGFAYLIDFGIARAADGTRVTSSGYMVGTWAYMAPERFTSAELDSRSDVYALACVLFECLTGEWPFPGDSLERQFAGHVSMPPPRPSEERAGLSVAFDEVIAWGLAKDPGGRYQSATELSGAARAACGAGVGGSGPSVAAPLVDAAGDWSNPTRLAARPSRRWSVKPVVLGAVAVAVVFVVVGVIALMAGDPGASTTATPAPTTAAPPTTTTQRPTTYGAQTVLPFTELNSPHGVGVDAAGNVYVADMENRRVVELAAGSSTQIVLPFTGLTQPTGLAASGPGDVYVADFSNPGVVAKLAAGATTQTVLGLTNITFPGSIAVDAAANVYVDGYDIADMVMLAAGTGVQTVVPFNDVAVGAFAVDTVGNVYATNLRDEQVVKLAAGWKTQTVLPFTDVELTSIAVDAHGNVYVTDITHRQVVKLAAGAKTQTVLPFTNLQKPVAIAVDAVGNVYVSDFEANQVVMLPVA